MDRNINATSKLLFQQLKTIKLEVKQESNVVKSTLDNLEVPELSVDLLGNKPDSSENVSLCNNNLNPNSGEKSDSDKIHDELEQTPQPDNPVVSRENEKDQVKVDEQSEQESELKTFRLKSKGKKCPLIVSCH